MGKRLIMGNYNCNYCKGVKCLNKCKVNGKRNKQESKLDISSGNFTIKLNKPKIIENLNVRDLSQDQLIQLLRKKDLKIIKKKIKHKIKHIKSKKQKKLLKNDLKQLKKLI